MADLNKINWWRLITGTSPSADTHCVRLWHIRHNKHTNETTPHQRNKFSTVGSKWSNPTSTPLTKDLNKVAKFHRFTIHKHKILSKHRQRVQHTKWSNPNK